MRRLRVRTHYAAPGDGRTACGVKLPLVRGMLLATDPGNVTCIPCLRVIARATAIALVGAARVHAIDDRHKAALRWTSCGFRRNKLQEVDNSGSFATWSRSLVTCQPCLQLHEMREESQKQLRERMTSTRLVKLP